MASVNIKPLEDKILVQANEAETTTASGLVIPDTAKEKPQEAPSSPSAPAAGTKMATSASRWTSRKATSSSTASTAEPRSSTPARST